MWHKEGERWRKTTIRPRPQVDKEFDDDPDMFDSSDDDLSDYPVFEEEKEEKTSKKGKKKSKK